MLGTHTRLYSVQGNMTEAIPTTALRNNRMGETKFFTYHNVKDLKVGSSVVVNTACGGRFCDRQIVSVRFEGTLREQAEAEPVAFNEVWHLVKPTDAEGAWRIAGVQQAN